MLQTRSSPLRHGAERGRDEVSLAAGRCRRSEPRIVVSKSKRRLYRLILLILVLLLLGGLAVGSLFLARQLRPRWFHEVVAEREVSAVLERDGALLLLEATTTSPASRPAVRVGCERRGDRELLLRIGSGARAPGRASAHSGRARLPHRPRQPLRRWPSRGQAVRKRAAAWRQPFRPPRRERALSDASASRTCRRRHWSGKTAEAQILVEGKGPEAPSVWLLAGDELWWFDGAGKLSRKPLAGGRAKLIAEEGAAPRSFTLHERTLYWTVAGKNEVRALSLDPASGSVSGPRTLAADVCPEGAARSIEAKLYLECPGSPERHGELFELPSDGGAPRPLLQTDQPGSFTYLRQLGDRFVWWEQAGESLFTAPVAGGELRKLLAGVTPIDMALVGGSLYVSDQSLTRVVRADW